MDTHLSQNSIASARAEAARDLGIIVESPFTLVARDGTACLYIARVPDFGSSKGTLLCLPDEWDVDGYDEVAEIHGYYCSGVYPESYRRYSQKEFIATLNDWGWHGVDPPPSWYAGLPGAA